MNKLAIVILNWNGREMLQRYLPSVLCHSQGMGTVYVADNASTDESVAFLRQEFPQVGLLLLDKNYGFAEGYNRALAQIEADYYLLLNSDIEVTEGWLSPMLSFLDNHPDYAACQPKLLSIHRRGQFEYAGAAGGYIDRLGYPFCRGRVFDTVEGDKGQYDTLADIHWATGACLLVRSDAYKEVGGLDDRFFAHCEEIDFCWRLRLKGYKLACIPESKVYHVGGGTLPKGNPMKTYLNFRNNLTMLYKNLCDEELRPVMCRRWWLDRLAAWQTLILNRNLADFKAIYKARRDYKRWRSDFAEDRAQIQSQRKISAQAEKCQFSILWEYYAKRKHHYSSLGHRRQENRQPVKTKQIPNAVIIPELIALIEQGHTVTLPLKGISMRPFLEDGRDKAVLTRATTFKKGDAVLAEIEPKRYVLHRIVRIDGDDVTLMGDGNLSLETCKRSDIKAFAMGFYRKGRGRLEKTNGLKWTLYSFVWMALRPVRRYLLALHRRYIKYIRKS